MRRRLTATILAGGLVLAACAGSADSASEDVAAPMAAEGAAESDPDVRDGVAPAEGEAAGPAGGGGTTASPVGGADLAALAGRDVIRTASIVVESADVDQAVAEVERVTFVAGGFLGTVERHGGDHPGAVLTLRVPGDEFTQVLADLRGLGQVVSERQSADDVTDQVVDVQARITTAEASIERVRALLDEATVLGDVVSLEAELSRRVAELESLKGRRRVLEDQVSLSTITVEVREPGELVAAGIGESDLGFLPGLRSGWATLVDVTRVAGTVLGALLPFAMVLAVVTVPLVAWRRRRTGPTSATTTPQPPATPTPA